MKMNNHKQQGKIIEPTVPYERDRGKGDNPPLPVMSISQVDVFMKYRRGFMSRYNLQEEAFDVFVSIVRRWTVERKSSTAYSLSNDKKYAMTMTCRKIRGLHSKGLVEVCGFGKYGSKAYCPSLVGMMELQPLCKFPLSA